MIERDGPWAAREGLITVGVLLQRTAQRAVIRSLPRITEARILVAKVEERLGEQLYADPIAGPGNRLLYVRDRDDPRLLVSRVFLELDVDVPAPPPIPLVPLPGAVEASPPPPGNRPAVLPGPDRVPGSLRIAEGPAYMQITYGDDGTRCEVVQTAGDAWTWGHHPDDRSFAIDPFAKPAQEPPLGLYCRGDLREDGHDLDTLADMVAELDPARLVLGRVYLPVPTPGGVHGAWVRGLFALREALWEGRIGEDEVGWAVIDAWNGTVIAVGETLSVAFDAWKEQVAVAQPLPPRDPPPRKPSPELPAEEPSSSHDPEKGITRFSSGTVTLVSVPRVALDWPAARPENVPAIAVRLGPPAPFPAGWEAYGFTRRVRLIGEHGGVCTGFLREEPGDRFTLVGEGAAEALDPATLDADLDAADVRQRRDLEDTGLFGDDSPYDNPKYPWVVSSYHAWDTFGRTPLLRAGSLGWSAEVAVRGFDADRLRWTVTRARPA